MSPAAGRSDSSPPDDSAELMFDFEASLVDIWSDYHLTAVFVCHEDNQLLEQQELNLFDSSMIAQDHLAPFTRSFSTPVIGSWNQILADSETKSEQKKELRSDDLNSYHLKTRNLKYSLSQTMPITEQALLQQWEVAQVAFTLFERTVRPEDRQNISAVASVKTPKSGRKKKQVFDRKSSQHIALEDIEPVAIYSFNLNVSLLLMNHDVIYYLPTNVTASLPHLSIRAYFAHPLLSCDQLQRYLPIMVHVKRFYNLPPSSTQNNTNIKYLLGHYKIPYQRPVAFSVNTATSSIVTLDFKRVFLMGKPTCDLRRLAAWTQENDLLIYVHSCDTLPAILSGCAATDNQCMHKAIDCTGNTKFPTKKRSDFAGSGKKSMSMPVNNSVGSTVCSLSTDINKSLTSSAYHLHSFLISSLSIYGFARLSLADLFRSCLYNSYTADIIPVLSRKFNSSDKLLPTRNPCMGYSFDLDIILGTYFKCPLPHQLRHPFRRALIFIPYESFNLTRMLLNKIALSNARALNYDLESPISTIISNLSAIKLTPQQLSDETLDIISGCHVCDGYRRIFVLEGLASFDSTKGTAFEQLLSELMQYAHSNLEFKLLHNLDITFLERRYGQDSLMIMHIRLVRSLHDLLADTRMYLKPLTASYQALRKLSSLSECAQLREAVYADLFPSNIELAALIKMHGTVVNDSDLAIEASSLTFEKSLSLTAPATMPFSSGTFTWNDMQSLDDVLSLNKNA